MTGKKNLFIIFALIIVAGAVVYFWNGRQKQFSPKPGTTENVTQPESASPESSSQIPSFDTNDYLDQALQELETVE